MTNLTDAVAQALKEELERHGYNMTVGAYISQCVHALRNISLTIHWSSGGDGLDRSAGMLYLIVVPLIYFLTTGLILVTILVVSWYSHRGAHASSDHSSSSFSTPLRAAKGVVRSADRDFSLAIERESQHFKTWASVTKDPVESSTAGWSVRSSIRTSRRNTTEQNLRVALEARRSMRGAADGSLRVESNKSLAQADMHPVASRSMTSIVTMSSDSLEDQVAVDLKSSMESQKLLWSPDGELKPDSLYGKSRCNVATQASSSSHMFTTPGYITTSEPMSSPMVIRDRFASFEFLDYLMHKKAADRPKSAQSIPGVSKGTRTSLRRELLDKDNGIIENGLANMIVGNQHETTTTSSCGVHRTESPGGHLQENITEIPSTPMAREYLYSSYDPSVLEVNNNNEILYKPPKGFDYPDIVSMECHPSTTANRKETDSSPESSFRLPPVPQLPDCYQWAQSPYPGEYVTPLYTGQVPHRYTGSYEVLVERATEEASTESTEACLPRQQVKASAVTQMYHWPSDFPPPQDLEGNHEHEAGEGLSKSVDERQFPQTRGYLSSRLSLAYSTSQLELSTHYRSGWGPSDDSDVSSSDDSVSLPSSISRFHADKHEGREVPKSKYPMGGARLSSAQLSSVASSLPGDVIMDNTSTCPRLGSVTLSGSACSELSSGHHEVFAADQTRDNSLAEYLEISALASASGLENSAFIPDADVEPPDKEKRNSAAEQTFDVSNSGAGENHLPEQQTHKPPLSGSKRHRSVVGILRPGKVSTKERLREFGFIKMVGNRKYVINPSPGKFFRRNPSSSLGQKAMEKVRKSFVVKRLNESVSSRGKGNEADHEESQLLQSEPRHVRGKPPRVPRVRALST